MGAPIAAYTQSARDPISSTSIEIFNAGVDGSKLTGGQHLRATCRDNGGLETVTETVF